MVWALIGVAVFGGAIVLCAGAFAIGWIVAVRRADRDFADV